MTVAASRNCKKRRERSPIWKNGPKAVDGDSEAAGYLKAADPSEINFVGVVVSVAKVSGIHGNFAHASRS